MSFWNYLGGFALFNMVANWLARKHGAVGRQHPAGFYDAGYEARVAELQRQIDQAERKAAEYRRMAKDSSGCADGGYDVDDIDELQARIDDLEDELGDCDVLSDRYDRIQDEIGRLEARIEEVEDAGLCDDSMHDGLYGLHENLYDDSDDW